jgi:serine/threonine protein kinase/Tol biopolymer transport system component
MPLRAGTRLGPYEILEIIGAGGMGEVYRARDPKLGRDVAIKVLPDALLDADRLARFEREARVLASLNHPHIADIYGFEQSGDVHGLVLELVDGPTLADRLRTGSIQLSEVLGIARQIADALDAAHEKGIVHRDLKPANIKIARNGTVKVLDFGLAKVDADSGLTADMSHSPTVSVGGTREGVILGTAAYMSPEQARGQALDKRTDIWSFGCVCFEMLTGRQAFPGETVSDTIVSILSREPDWTVIDSDAPPEVQRLLRRCLEKDATHRLRDIGDVRYELDHLLAELKMPRGARAGRMAPASRERSRMPMVAPIVAAAILLSVGGVFLARRLASPTVVLEPPLQLTDFTDSVVTPSLSPDGRMLTFIRGGNFGDSAPRGQIFVKLLPKGEPVQLTRDQFTKEQPVFSPDGSRIVYTAVMPGFTWDSWQVPVLGGAPQPFLPNASGLIWLDDRQMMYAEIMSGVHMGIVTSSESRSDSRTIYFPRGQGSMAHRSARSPDGKSVLLAEMDGSSWLPCRLVPFDGSAPGHPVGPPDGQCTTTAWSPDGRWMYFSSNAGGGFHIWRQRHPDGVPEQVTPGPTEQEGIAITPDGKYLITSMGLQHADLWMQEAGGERQLTSEGFAMLPSMGLSGKRVFYLMRTGFARAYASGELWSMNLATGEKQRALPGHVMANYSISADEQRVVFTSSGSSNGDGVWIADLDRRTPPRQLTRDGAFRAFFGAPGEIVYMSQGDERHLYRINEDGTRQEMIVPDPVTQLITVSPDGRWAVTLVTRTTSGGGTIVRFIPLRGGTAMDVCNEECGVGFGPNRLQAPMFNWSPDGKWLYVGLQYFGLRTARTVVLPYRSGVPLATLWPKGMKSEDDVMANPGARVLNDGNALPATDPSAHLSWRRTTQSNLYRVALPN